jgi:arsenite methyltransferase
MSTDLKEAVKQHYASVARGETAGCGCGTVEAAQVIGYSKEDLAVAGDANLGLGCGNPLALAEIKPGMTVLDLGSGAGFDTFLAWRKVGPSGRVIGVDMTDDMLARARENADKLGATNVEFRKGLIEKLPVEDNSVDLVISNCVINLSTNKPAVFGEIARVLKPGGRFAVSDLVLMNQLPEAVANSIAAYVGCIAGASQMGEYVRLAFEAGLTQLAIPQIAYGKQLATVVAPTEGGCCGSKSDSAIADAAARAVASIKLHGTKAESTPIDDCRLLPRGGNRQLNFGNRNGCEQRGFLISTLPRPVDLGYAVPNRRRYGAAC